MSSRPERERLGLLLKVNSILKSELTLEQALGELIEEVVETLGATRGFVLLRDGEKWNVAAVRYKREQDRVSETLYSTSVVKTVAETDQPVLAMDAIQSPFGNRSSVLLMGLLSIVCVPLRWSGKTQGMVYADNSVKSGVFKEPDLELLSAIADQASRKLETAALQEQLDHVREVFLAQLRESGGANLETLEKRAGERAVEVLLHSGSEPHQTTEPPVEDGKVRTYLMGDFRVETLDHTVTSWKSRKDRELFAYLALHQGQVVDEERLMELFWSRGGKKARHSLHNSITQLRKKLHDTEREIVQRKLDGYTLGETCWVDVVRFGECFEKGKAAARSDRWDEALPPLQEAERLCNGEFLEGCFSDWIVEIRESLNSRANECRGLLADYFGRRGTHVLAVELWKRMLEYDRCDESAYRGLLQAYRELGRRAEAARTFQACVKAFEEELDLPPPDDFEALIDF